MKLSDRMKRYESVSKDYLMPRTPVIIRVDGKAFHTWTKGLQEPFDGAFYAAMAKTALTMAETMQNAVFAYGQSDEISFLLKDYDGLNTEQWFNGNIQKIASVSASMASAFFNSYVKDLEIPDRAPAVFDARVFNLPMAEVCNYFIWRQEDGIRNSVQRVGRYYLGHKSCLNKSNEELKEELRQMDEPFDWERDLENVYKRGYSYVRGQKEIEFLTPQFKHCREFVDIHVQPNMEKGEDNADG